jgi:hypothetical protein
MELYKSEESKIKPLKPESDSVIRVTASAYVCGEKMKRAIKNAPTVDKHGEYIAIGIKKLSIETLCYKIDLQNKAQTVNTYKHFLVKGLPGILDGLSNKKLVN